MHRILNSLAARLAAGMLTIVLVGAAPARAGIDWAGGIWPNDGTVVGFALDLEVWAQVWVDGVTEQVGPAPGIRSVLYYAIDGAALTDSVMMDYVQELGTADEYVGRIPATVLDGASKVKA